MPIRGRKVWSAVFTALYYQKGQNFCQPPMPNKCYNDYMVNNNNTIPVVAGVLVSASAGWGARESSSSRVAERSSFNSSRSDTNLITGVENEYIKEWFYRSERVCIVQNKTSCV